MIDASGIGTYIRGLLSALDPQVKGLSVTLLGNPSKLPDGPWIRNQIETPIYSIREQFTVPAAFRRSGASLLHVPHYNVPMATLGKTMVTIHDLIHLIYPDQLPSRAARVYANLFFKTFIPRTAAIMTVSNHTKKDLITRLHLAEDRIHVAYPAVSNRFHAQSPADVQATKKRLGLPDDYLLYVGNIKRLKNIPRLLECYRHLKERDPNIPALVLVGKNFIPGFKESIASSSSIIWLGEVAHNELPRLYSGALLFVFPSLYEGFGLPPLEAMACGTPVVCSNRASLPEVVGDAAVLVDPEDSEALENCIVETLNNSQRRRELSQKGLLRAAQFSWQTLATQTQSLYRHCIEQQ